MVPLATELLLASGKLGFALLPVVFCSVGGTNEMVKLFFIRSAGSEDK